MKSIKIYPKNLKGNIVVPPSKSLSHRAIICAALSRGQSIIKNIDYSDDILATCEAVENFGVVIHRYKDSILIESIGSFNTPKMPIDCKESGSTLRFLIPIAASQGVESEFIGKGRLSQRPLDPYYDIFEKQKLKYSLKSGRLPLLIKGKLKPDDFIVDGSISSQFISGLLFALPILEDDSKILINTELESKPYIDLTIDTLKDFGVYIQNNDYREFIIKGKQSYTACDFLVEGDFSQVAFFIVGGILGSEIFCKGLKTNSKQGDSFIVDIIKSMGGKIEVNEETIYAMPGTTYGTVIDASQCPDLVPILAVLGALSEGVTEIINAKRLRLKESDRLSAICTELNKIGANIIENKEGLIINGKNNLFGGEVDSWNDHRIAMALAIAATRCDNPMIIHGIECVKKSYPRFWEDYKKLGGCIDEWNVGQ